MVLVLLTARISSVRFGAGIDCTDAMMAAAKTTVEMILPNMVNERSVRDCVRVVKSKKPSYRGPEAKDSGVIWALGSGCNAMLWCGTSA